MQSEYEVKISGLTGSNGQPSFIFNDKTWSIWPSLSVVCIGTRCSTGGCAGVCHPSIPAAHV
jgi:hypothetical protein